jgi:hypothetical protein
MRHGPSVRTAPGCPWRDSGPGGGGGGAGPAGAGAGRGGAGTAAPDHAPSSARTRARMRLPLGGSHVRGEVGVRLRPSHVALHARARRPRHAASVAAVADSCPGAPRPPSPHSDPAPSPAAWRADAGPGASVRPPLGMQRPAPGSSSPCTPRGVVYPFHLPHQIPAAPRASVPPAPARGAAGSPGWDRSRWTLLAPCSCAEPRMAPLHRCKTEALGG